MRRVLLGLAAAVAVTASAGCSVKPPIPGGPGTYTTARGSSSDIRVRFVVLVTPDDKPIDITPGPQATSATGASGLKSGSVTDYLTFPTRTLTVSAHEDGRLLQDIEVFSGSDTSFRYTVVIGVLDGDIEAVGFKERDGRVAMETLPVEAPAGKAVLFSASPGLQPGTGPKDPFPSLGGGIGKCLTTAPNLGSNFLKTLSLSTTSSHYYIAVDPGEHNLAWYAKKQSVDDEKCAVPLTGSGKVELAAGQHAYVVPWLADSNHFKAMIVPVSADGRGDADVVTLPAEDAYPAR